MTYGSARPGGPVRERAARADGRDRAVVGTVLVALVSLAAGCEGTEDIPNSTIICCQTLDEVATRTRIDCVYNPDGRVVEYWRCPDAGPGDDAGEAGE